MREEQSINVNVVIRCIISFASILTAFVSLQNFIRLIWMEIADARHLEAIELFMRNRSEKIGSDEAYMPMIVLHRLNKRTMISPDGKDGGGLERVLMAILFQQMLYRALASI